MQRLHREVKLVKASDKFNQSASGGGSEKEEEKNDVCGDREERYDAK
jgi:hypothetical protein